MHRKGAAMHMFLPVGVAYALAISLLVSSASAQSDAANAHQSTTQPADGRFEIVQSPLAARWTFRLDRYTGHVDQLARIEHDEVTWQEMPVRDLPSISNPTKPRFILFTSALAARHTFLMDTETGQTWIITSFSLPGSEPIVVWTPFLR